MARLWRIGHRSGVFRFITLADDHHHRHTIRHSHLRLGILTLWPFGSHVVDQPQDGGCLSLFMNRMNSESHQACLNGRVVNEEDDSQHSLVLRRWFLDCLDSSWLWSAPEHHYRRLSLGQDALPADAPGTGSIRKGDSQQRFLI